MVGESGTSHTGKKHYYYKCGSSKRKTGCDKKAVKKDWIEDLVVRQTMNMIFDDKALDVLADVLMDFQKQENTDIPILKRQLEETAQGIENLLNAIQQGILTTSTKARLEQLEETKTQLEISMAQAELKKPLLSKKQILFWLHRFRGIDTSKADQRQRLIDSFVNAVYVYDDKIILTFNYRDGTETITLKDIEGSDLGRTPPPKLEIAVVFTTAISRLTTEIPQTDFCFDHLKGTPFRKECPSFVYCGVNSAYYFSLSNAFLIFVM